MQWNTSLTWVTSSPMMPQSAMILTTAIQNQQFLWKTVKESMAESLVPPLHKDTCIQGRSRSHPPVRCRDLGSLSEIDHQHCLRSILGIKWQDHVSNEEVLKIASLPSIESILHQVQLRWTGQVTRMEDVGMPKAVFFSELQEGKHHHGALKSVTKIS